MKEMQKNVRKILERIWVFATNSDFSIPISLKSDVVDLPYFKTTMLVGWNNLCLKYQCEPSGCKVIGIRINWVCGKNSDPDFVRFR